MSVIKAKTNLFDDSRGLYKGSLLLVYIYKTIYRLTIVCFDCFMD